MWGWFTVVFCLALFMLFTRVVLQGLIACSSRSYILQSWVRWTFALRHFVAYSSIDPSTPRIVDAGIVAVIEELGVLKPQIEITAESSKQSCKCSNKVSWFLEELFIFTHFNVMHACSTSFIIIFVRYAFSKLVWWHHTYYVLFMDRRLVTENIDPHAWGCYNFILTLRWN